MSPRTSTTGIPCILLSVFLAACRGPGDPPSPPAGHEWPVYGGDKRNTKYSPLDQIHRGNVADLRVAWRWSFPEEAKKEAHPEMMAFIYEATPLMVEGVLYGITNFNQVAAIHPGSGRTLWAYDPESYEARSHARGLAYWSDGTRRRLLLNTADFRLISVDALTGLPDQEFGREGVVDLLESQRRAHDRSEQGVNSPPIVVGEVVVVGSNVSDANPHRRKPPGDVRGFDVRTGELLWTFHVVPEEGEFGVETWQEESWRYGGNTNVWTVMSADEELGLVYLPISTPTNDWYGGHRPGDNLFAESLVCLDARTGERVWHFQAIHHGLWDWDLPAAPNLVDIEVEGRSIRALAQVSKQGFTFVLDRTTGEPVWPIEERPVPQSTVPGERSSPTQPHPTKPPPFDRQGVTPDDLIDFTPELRAEALSILEVFRYGPLFSPPTVEPFIILPGAGGGANWNGAAFDPETGLLYVPSTTRPSAMRLVPPDPQTSDFRYQGAGVPLQGPQGLPLFKPPYGRITAFDLNQGEIRWVEPLGEGPRNHPALAGLDLPRLGWPQRGVPLVTRTLLFIGQEGRFFPNLRALSSGQEVSPAILDDAGRFEPRFYAYDKATGELIWEMELDANVTGGPMTYLFEGKQYIVFPVGGTKIPEELVALSLP